MRNGRWLRLLTYVSGSANQELLLRNEYLAAENRILRPNCGRAYVLADPERATLAEIGKRLGRKALREVTASRNAIPSWLGIDGLSPRSSMAPNTGSIRALLRFKQKLRRWWVRMALENSGWGYDRIVGAIANLGHRLSDQTVKNVLRRHGIAPAPKRTQVTTWKDFLATHMNVVAGCDFFTVEVLTWRGLVTDYVLFFLHLESRRVQIAGITRHPDQEWMEQIGWRHSRVVVPTVDAFEFLNLFPDRV